VVHIVNVGQNYTAINCPPSKCNENILATQNVKQTTAKKYHT